MKCSSQSRACKRTLNKCPFVPWQLPSCQKQKVILQYSRLEISHDRSSLYYKRVEVFICLYTHLLQGLGCTGYSINIFEWMNQYSVIGQWWALDSQRIYASLSVFGYHHNALSWGPDLSHNQDNLNLSSNTSHVSASILISLFIIEIGYTENPVPWSTTMTSHPTNLCLVLKNIIQSCPLLDPPVHFPVTHGVPQQVQYIPNRERALCKLLATLRASSSTSVVCWIIRIARS